MGVRAEVGTVPSLDGMRGVAVLWVVMFHYVALGDATRDAWIQAIGAIPLVDAVVRNGYLGVDLFFLISGFLLTLPWFVHAAAGQQAPPARDFYARRVRRIVPAYYVQLALLFLLFIPLLRGWDYWKRDLYVIAWNALAHAGFLQLTSPLTSGSLAVNGALWTLAIEAQYYLLLPLAAPLLVRAPVRVTIAAFGIAIVWQTLARHGFDAWIAQQMQWGAHWRWTEETVRHLQLTQLPGYLGHFALGSVLGLAWLQWRDKPSRLRPWLWLAATGAFALLLAAVSTREAIAGEQTWLVTTLTLGTLLLAAALGGPVARGLLDRGPLAFVGRVSYSAYLYHLPLLLLWNTYAPGRGSIGSLPAYLAVVLLASWVSWRFVERRFRRGSAIPR